MVYNIEKMLKEGGDKIQGPEKGEVETVLAESKKLLEGTPGSAELKAQHEKLTHASHKLAEVMYKANAASAAPGGPAAGSPSDGSSGGETKKDDTVIDAEYVDVDDKK
jgi:molecular chaperone DnaK